MDTDFLINVHLPREELKKIQMLGEESHPVIFSVVGDVDGKGDYSKSVIAVTDTFLKVYNFRTDTVEYTVPFDEIERIFVKRMYGNAFIRVVKKGETKPINVFRYTFSVAQLCDSLVLFVSKVCSGEKIADQKEAISSAYLKQLSTCPKCGRTLSAPGVKCINCEGKKKLISRLSVYMKPEIKPLLFSLIVSAMTTSLALIPPYLTRTLVDDILKEGNKADTQVYLFGRFPMSATRSLLYIGIFLAIITIIRFSCAALHGYILRKSGDRIVKSLRNDVYEHAQHLPMRFYDKTSTGSVINRISGDSSTLQSFMLRVTQEVVAQGLYLVGIIVIMVATNPLLALYSLIPVPFVVVGARIFRFKIVPFYHRIWRRWAAVSNVLTDTIPGIRVIKSFTNERKATERFNKKNEEWYQTDAQAGKILNIYPSVVNTFITLGSVVIWMVGGLAVLKAAGISIGNITAGILVSFITYASMFYGPVGFFANFQDTYQNAMSSAERIFDILDAEPEHDFGKGHKLATTKGKIEFRNVSFSFDKNKPVLKNINFVIEPGDIVGIVGTTGSGKSTLLNLFLRYYDDYQGKILVDGVDIRKIDIEYFRSQIGYVQQEPMMFHDTIFNNIAYGDVQYTVEDVIRAADIANAHQFIVRQPDGYDSVLGERGVGLSGGERQRLSIARAVLKNPSILAFDEATASVDSETEHLIQEAIENLISGRTTIMIAHRLSTLSKANKILVVDNGSILEFGTPQELLEKKGKYWKLVQIQTMADSVTAQKREERLDI